MKRDLMAITKESIRYLKEKRNEIIAIIISCIGENENACITYIEAEQKDDEQIDFKIGDDKFTLYAFMDIANLKIYLRTYHWVFSPNSLRGFEKILLNDCDILLTEEFIHLKELPQSLAVLQVR